MEQKKTISFDELVANSNRMYEKIGSLPCYIFALKYGKFPDSF